MARKNINALVDGYAHEWNKNLPVEITNRIAQFYEEMKMFNMGFNLNIHSPNLQFPNDQTVKKIKQEFDKEYSTCIFGAPFNRNDCVKFDISIRWKKCISSIFIGFITSSIDKSIKDWSWHLGSKGNKSKSVGIKLSATAFHDKKFLLYSKKHCTESYPEEFKSVSKFEEGDLFKLSFDFMKDGLCIYQNGKLCKFLTLKYYNQMTMAFCLYGENEEIEIVETKPFFYNDEF